MLHAYDTYPGPVCLTVSSSSSPTLFSPAQPNRKACRLGAAAHLLASYLRRETNVGVPGGVADARLVLHQLTLAQENVLARLMGVVLTGVTDHRVAVMWTEAAQLSRCLRVKIRSLFTGMHVRTGDGWGLRVMRAWTRGSGAAEGLGGAVVVKLGVGGFLSRG